jgi:60 kDa SS-A/Ro ribonucleoprotein
MMQRLHKWFSKRTEQTAPVVGAGQVKMRSGGYGWAVDDWMRLDRFLILGTEGGTYYVRECKLTTESAEAVLRCIQLDGQRVVARIIEISAAGRAPKNDPALFALAMCAKLGDEATKAAAYKALSKVARIGTHLFHFCEYAKAFGGLGGNGFKRALARWYTDKDAGRLALQAVKYQQRDGWSHRDVLRLSHPVAKGEQHQAIFEWMVKGWQGDVDSIDDVPSHLRLLWAFEKAKTTDKVATIVKLITDHRLPHECVPNDFKQYAEVWEALLQGMPVGAMLRNLNKLTAVGLLTNTSSATKRVRECARHGV